MISVLFGSRSQRLGPVKSLCSMVCSELRSLKNPRRARLSAGHQTLHSAFLSWSRRFNRTIVQSLLISVDAVKKHLKNVYGKLKVYTRTEAVVRARELGLLQRLAWPDYPSNTPVDTPLGA